MLPNIILAVLIIGLHAFWIYKLVTYDWKTFKEDSANDDFLKSVDK